MNKLFKKLLLLATVICTVCACTLAAACDDTPPNTDKFYTVTVLTPEGRGVAGVEIELLPDNGEAFYDGLTFTETTGADGVVKFDFKNFSDSTQFTVQIVSSISNGLNAPTSFYKVDVNKDGYELTFQLTRANYETISVSLDNKQDTTIYRPASHLQTGFYEMSCTSNEISLTDGDDVTVQSTFKLNGYNTILVYYTRGKAFTIGTATDALEFSCTFAPVETDGTANKPHALRADYAAVLNMEDGENVYLKNPVETSETGKIGGYPLQIDGENYTATVDGVLHSETFKVAGGKTLEIATADDNAGVAILTCRALSNTTGVTIGTENTVDIELLERTINDGTKDTTSLLWTTSSCSFSFTVTAAGRYRITVTALSGIESDKVIIGTVASVGGVSIVPTRVKEDGTPYGNNEKLPEASTTYVDYFFFSQDNLNRNRSYRAEFSTNGTFSPLNEGDTVSYKIFIEKVV